MNGHTSNIVKVFDNIGILAFELIISRKLCRFLQISFGEIIKNYEKPVRKVLTEIQAD